MFYYALDQQTIIKVWLIINKIIILNILNYVELNRTTVVNKDFILKKIGDFELQRYL
jgi:hypothetical protein